MASALHQTEKPAASHQRRRGGTARALTAGLQHGCEGGEREGQAERNSPAQQSVIEPEAGEAQVEDAARRDTARGEAQGIAEKEEKTDASMQRDVADQRGGSRAKRVFARVRNDAADQCNSRNDCGDERDRGEADPSLQRAAGRSRPQRSARRRRGHSEGCNGGEHEHEIRLRGGCGWPVRRGDPEIEGAEHQRGEERDVGDEREDQRPLPAVAREAKIAFTARQRGGQLARVEAVSSNLHMGDRREGIRCI